MLKVERETPPGHARDDWPSDRDVERHVRDFDHARLPVPKVVRAIGDAASEPVRLADLLAADRSG
jgi:hypothetical protein